VSASDALAHRAHEEDRPVTPPAPRTDPQLFPRSEAVFQRSCSKAKVTMRKSYGFCTFRCLEVALYHSLGKLPEPESTHEFF
jgi:hypothetical protein